MNILIRIFYLPYRFIYFLKEKLLLFYYKSNGAKIGKHTYIGPNVYLDVSHKPGKIQIGENCYITRNTSILVHSDAFIGGPLNKFINFKGGERIIKNVTIGNNVFIGFHCVILPGVKIGDNAVVGAMTLVNKDIPDGAIVGGVPMKILGSVDDKIKNYKNE